MKTLLIVIALLAVGSLAYATAEPMFRNFKAVATVDTEVEVGALLLNPQTGTLFLCVFDVNGDEYCRGPIGPNEDDERGW